MKKGADNLYRNVVLNTWATFVYFFAQWLLIIVITRLYGYGEAGTFTLAVSFSNIFGFVARFGMRSVQVADVERQYSDGQYFTSRILTSVVSLLPFAVALALCRYRLDLRNCCIAMMSYKLLEGFDDVIAGTFQRADRYQEIAVSYTLKAVLPFAAMTGLLLMKVELYRCIWAMNAAYTIVVMGYDLFHLRDLHFVKWSASGLKSLYIQCIPLMLAAIVDAVLLYLPRNAVEQVCGADALGYYGSISIVTVAISTLAGAVWGSLLTRYSKLILEKQWKNIIRLTAGIALLLLLFNSAVLVLGSLLGPFFFSVLYGKEILEHMDLLLPVMINALLLLNNSFFTCFLIPMKRRTLLLFTNIAAAVFCVAAVHYFTAQYGTVGACVCLSIALFIRFGLLIVSTVFLFGREMRVK